MKDINPLSGKGQLHVLREEYLDGDKEGRIHKAPVRSGFGNVSFVLMIRSEGSLCCKDACNDGNK